MERYSNDILAVCQRLHMSHTGAGDKFSDEEVARLNRWLVSRLDEWHEPHNNSKDYDDAVRALVLAVLAEGRT